MKTDNWFPENLPFSKVLEKDKIDLHIIELCGVVNSTPCFRTIGSCSGHIPKRGETFRQYIRIAGDTQYLLFFWTLIEGSNRYYNWGFRFSLAYMPRYLSYALTISRTVKEKAPDFYFVNLIESFSTILIDFIVEEKPYNLRPDREFLNAHRK